MRNLITLLAAATVLVACADDPHPTAPGSRSANGNVQSAADKTPVAQAKPADQVGFTKITKVYGNNVVVPAGGSGFSTAQCPAGTTLLGGGFVIGSSSAYTGAPRLSWSADNQTNGWSVGFGNGVTGAGEFEFYAVAYCVS